MGAVLDGTLFLLWVGGVALLMGLLHLIPRARTICRRESARTRTEAEAFDRFEKRVEDVPTRSVRTASTGPALAPVATSFVPAEAGGEIREVRTAYRETVLSVSHHDEDYGETFDEHVREEFDASIAAVLTDGGRLTPEVKRGIRTNARAARDRRERFVDALAVEADSLETSYRRLKADASRLERLDDRPFVDHSYGDLEATWYRLRDLRERVEVTLSDRQETLHSIDGDPRIADAGTLYGYLYRQLPTIEPVLSDGMGLYESIEDAEHAVVDSLTRRV